MTKKDLLEHLKDIPEDATVCLSTLMLLTEEPEEAYECVFDYPISGIAFNESDNELRLAVKTKKIKDAYHLAAFGVEVKKLD